MVISNGVNRVRFQQVKPIGTHPIEDNRSVEDLKKVLEDESSNKEAKITAAYYLGEKGLAAKSCCSCFN